MPCVSSTLLFPTSVCDRPVVRAWHLVISMLHTTLELEMSTIEVSEQVEESPAEAALKIEARIYGLVAPYTDEQLKAIRPS